MRAHPEPIGHYAPPLRSQVVHTVPAVLFAVRETDRLIYAGDQFTRFFAHDAAEAARIFDTHAPRAVVVDWDEPGLRAPDLCASLGATPRTSVLVTTADVANVPAILRAGCHGVLLKPFAPNLLAARLGRLLRDTSFAMPRSRTSAPQIGTNRVWPDTACPNCGTTGATSFDFSSYRRMWYACLACDATWLGPRQE